MCMAAQFRSGIPLTYEPGGLQPSRMDSQCLQAAFSKADLLLKVYSLLTLVLDLNLVLHMMWEKALGCSHFGSKCFLAYR